MRDEMLPLIPSGQSMADRDSASRRLLEKLVPTFPGASWNDNGYIEVVCRQRVVSIWISVFEESNYRESVKFRIIVRSLKDLHAVSEEERDRVVAALNNTLRFGRFDGQNVHGINLDYELPFMPQLAVEVVAETVERLSETAELASASISLGS